MVRFADAAVRDWDFPRAVAGVALLLEHARERGVADDVVLSGSGLTAVELVAAVEVTAAQELRVVRNLRGRLGEVGPEVGRRYRASTFGVLGYALLASRTVHEAMDVALRFLDLSHTFAIPRVELDGQRVRIVVDGAGLPADVRRFLVERDAAAIRAVLAELARLPIRSAGDEAARVLSFDLAELDRPLAHSEPASLAACEAACRDVVGARRERSGFAGQVRVLVTQRLPVGAPTAAVAASLGMSERTVRRRLAADGTSYQHLLDEVRASMAEELLGTGRLSVEEVGLRLGYAEASSFIAAHRRWTGETPGARGRR
ncbi:helix-turn-helix transcriptional regulator [Nocardioides sp. URHA0020]|uniref:helix-turn-helix transcriptional regulator n=1 Tax=Nocardioides sp. URHA0020 TaxID=1380392 RepID=UPI0004901567|nr:AraC family transcriptional regulator [Nocardioides sp. URHA0020]